METKIKVISGILIIVAAIGGYMLLSGEDGKPDDRVVPPVDNRTNITTNVSISGDNQTIPNNTAPIARSASVIPDYPTVFQDISCWYSFYDPDNPDRRRFGDGDSGTIIRWFKDDIEQKDLESKGKISSNYTSAGEVWKCEVTPSDGKSFGTPVNSTPEEILGVNITDKPNQINVTLLWNKTFESEIVSVDLESFPPRIVVTMDEVAYLDENGNLIKQLDLNKTSLWEYPEILVSNKNNRLYVVTISSEGTILYDDNGEVLWKSDATGIDGKKVIPPVPRYGSIAEFEYEQRNLLFYDENGTFIKKVDANVTFLESYNGSLFVIVAYMGYSKSKGRGIYKLISYNTSGDKLWEHEASAFEIKISPNGKYIFPSLSGKYFKIYTNTGELLDEIVFPYSGINVAISPDNKFAIISTTYEIYMYEIETKELKWKYDILTDFIHPTNLNYTEEEWREKIIIMRARAIDTSVNAEFTVFGIDGGYVRLLNNKGERIWQTKVEGNYTIVFKAPIVKISRDGQNIIIYTKHNLYYFKINEK